MRRLFDRALDLVFPPHGLDGGTMPQTTGLSGRAWEQISFIDHPLCDGCGQHKLLITIG
jgi:hypothetical protein